MHMETKLWFYHHGDAEQLREHFGMSLANCSKAIAHTFGEPMETMGRLYYDEKPSSYFFPKEEGDRWYIDAILKGRRFSTRGRYVRVDEQYQGVGLKEFLKDRFPPIKPKKVV